MPLDRIAVLLPCDQLGEFPTHATSDDAAGLLAAWTVAWRPALLDLCGAPPVVLSTYELPPTIQLAAELLIVPEYACSDHVNEWLEEATSAETSRVTVVRASPNRQELAAEIDRVLALPAVDSEINAEFMALGYARLQLELMIRSLHYASSLLDTGRFGASAVAAARAVLGGDAHRPESIASSDASSSAQSSSAPSDAEEAESSDALTACYDQLLQARNNSYAIGTHLIDVTLIADTLWGAPLREAVENGPPTNFLLSADQAKRLAEAEPASAAALKSAFTDRRASLVGGRGSEASLAELIPESMANELSAARGIYQAALGRAPKIFGQFSGALPPRLPQLLAASGFAGAMLSTFDGRPIPRSDETKTVWVGPDGAQLQAVCATPLDAGLPETLLSIGERLGRRMQSDHVATLLIAGWPGRRSPFFDDLCRVVRRSELLGAFKPLEEYFESTSPADCWLHWSDNHESASAPERARSRAADIDAQHRALASAVAAFVTGAAPENEPGGAPPETPEMASPAPSSAQALAKSARLSTDMTQTSSGEWAVINGWNFARPVSIAREGPPVSAKQVPGMGLAIASRPMADTPPRAEGRFLRNEFLEVTFDESTGALRSLRSYQARRSVMSQRLVVSTRLTAASPDAGTVMAADELIVTANDAARGAIRSRGRLLARTGAVIGRFQMEATLPAWSPLVTLDIQVDLDRPLEGPADRVYCANRIAWRDEGATLSRGRQWARLPVDRRRFIVEDYVEIMCRESPLAMIVAQPTRCQQTTERMLDAVLIEPGQRSGSARLSLAADCRRPLQAALTAACEPLCAPAPKSNRDAQGWWFRAPAPNVIVSRLEVAPQQRTLWIRLIETEGREAAFKLAAWRPFKSARRTNFVGKGLERIDLEAGEALVEMPAYDWLQIEATW